MKTFGSLASIIAVSLLMATPVAAQRVDKATQLHQDMRKLWTDHTVWTRDYIVAAVDDRPDAQELREVALTLGVGGHGHEGRAGRSRYWFHFTQRGAFQQAGRRGIPGSGL